MRTNVAGIRYLYYVNFDLYRLVNSQREYG